MYTEMLNRAVATSFAQNYVPVIDSNLSDSPNLALL